MEIIDANGDSNPVSEADTQQKEPVAVVVDHSEEFMLDKGAAT